MTFPVVGDKKHSDWHLRQSKFAEYKEVFPHLDVLAESRKALQSLRDNSQRRKTARGMPKFLSGWLERAQDSGRAQGATNKHPSGRLGRVEAPPGKYDKIGIRINVDTPAPSTNGSD